MWRLHTLRWLTLLLLATALLSVRSIAQLGPGAPFAPVPKEDLALKDNPQRPGSPAMILEREVYTDDEKRYQTEWKRIKVFTEEGRQYADVEIPYIAKTTSVEDIRARTVHPDGTIIEFHGAVFDNVVVKYKKLRYDEKVFSLPAVDVGSVIEYAYTVRWKDKIPDVFRHPANYLLSHQLAMPTATWTIQNELFIRHARFTLRPVKNARLGWYKVRLDQGPTTQPDDTLRLEISNVAPLEEEDYMPPEAMLTSRVHFFYTTGSLGLFWSQWGSMRAELMQKFLQPTKALERAVEQIAPASDPPETRLRKLYGRVQQIRYLSYEPTRTSTEIKREHLEENKSAEDILRHGYATANEINFLFVALAHAAGFDATIVQVADRSTTEFQTGVPDPSQLNAMIVRVHLQQKTVYLDPATRFCPYGLLPWAEGDTVGVEWGAISGEVLNIPGEEPGLAKIERDTELHVHSDGSADGDVQVSFSGQEALDTRLAAVDEDDAGRRKLMEDRIKQWLPAGAVIDLKSVDKWDSSEDPLRVKCHFRLPGYVSRTTQRMLFAPALFYAVGEGFTLQHTARANPVYLQYAYERLDKTTVIVDRGYRVEALPTNTVETTPWAEFRVTSTIDGDKVRVERHLVMTGYYFRPQYYGSLRNFLNRIRKSDLQHVVLHVGAAQNSPAVATADCGSSPCR